MVAVLAAGQGTYGSAGAPSTILATAAIPTVDMVQRPPATASLPNGPPIEAVRVDQPWPPFVMVYRETSTDLATGQPFMQVLRLEYRNRHHFTTTLLEHLTAPFLVGSRWTTDGNTSIEQVSHMGPPRVGTFPPGQVPQGPTGWRSPGLLQDVLSQNPPGFSVTSIGDGLANITRVIERDGEQAVRIITVRESEGIPVRFVRFSNGVEIERFEVIDLQIGSQALANVTLTPLPTAAPMPTLAPSPTPLWPPFTPVAPGGTATSTSVQWVNPTPPPPVLVTLTPGPGSTTPTPGATAGVPPSATPTLAGVGTATATLTLVPTPTPRPTMPPAPTIVPLPSMPPVTSGVPPVPTVLSPTPPASATPVSGTATPATGVTPAS
jgi:hypothetical protein